jgi:L-asparaginase
MAKQLNLLSCGGAITSMNDSGLARPTSPALVVALVQELWLTPVAHTAVSAEDSAVSTPESWTRLLEAVRGVDGPVLITHGTDTLAWTAAALAVTDVADLRPVVMTGANVPFGELSSDARNNLAAALTVCRQMEKGVWVVFAGSLDGPAVVIEGGFARKTLPTGSCITDVSGSPFATVSAEVLVSHRQPRKVDLGVDRTGTSFSAEVASFRCWPGLALPTDPPADRVVMELYALSTAPTDVLGTISRWTASGAHVQAVPSSPAAPRRSSARLQSGAELVATGVDLRPGSTFELAVCSQMLC